MDGLDGRVEEGECLFGFFFLNCICIMNIPLAYSHLDFTWFMLNKTNKYNHMSATILQGGEKEDGGRGVVGR